MKAHRVRLRLIEIREEISGIQSLTRDADLVLFSSSWAMKRAVEHALLIIAEAREAHTATDEGFATGSAVAQDQWSGQSAAARISSYRSRNIMVDYK